MKLVTNLQSFHKNTAGAVTLDWLVLSVAIVGLAVVILSSLSSIVYPSNQLRVEYTD